MADIELTYSSGVVPRDAELPARENIATVFDELDFQTAVQAYLWAIPIVSWAQWMDVHTNIFGATSSDIVVYRSYRDRLGLITANATTPYILNFFDLGVSGPLVIELPPGPTAGGIADFWQREVAVLGEMGPDAGKGGKTVVVGPGQSAEDTGEYTVVHSPMMHIMFGFRTLDPDPARSGALVEAVRVYPYANRENPTPTRLVSPDGKPWSGIQPRGLRYWELLHDIVQDEPVEERDRFPMAWLRQLGIERANRLPRTIACGRSCSGPSRWGRCSRKRMHSSSGSPVRATGPIVSGTWRLFWTTLLSGRTTTTSSTNARRGSTRQSVSRRR